MSSFSHHVFEERFDLEFADLALSSKIHHREKSSDVHYLEDLVHEGIVVQPRRHHALIRLY